MEGEESERILATLPPSAWSLQDEESKGEISGEGERSSERDVIKGMCMRKERKGDEPGVTSCLFQVPGGVHNMRKSRW